MAFGANMALLLFLLFRRSVSLLFNTSAQAQYPSAGV
jgi:hypothetical protein